jgi:hypothetical protein
VGARPGAVRQAAQPDDYEALDATLLARLVLQQVAAFDAAEAKPDAPPEAKAGEVAVEVAAEEAVSLT